MRRAAWLAATLVAAQSAAAAAAPPESAPAPGADAPAGTPESAPWGTPPAPAAAPPPAPRADPFRPRRFDGRLQLSFYGAWLRAGATDALEAPAPGNPGGHLGWGELRLDAGASELGGAPVDARIDFRVRWDLAGVAAPPRDADGNVLDSEVDRESWRCGPVTVPTATPVPTSGDPRRCHELDLRALYVSARPGRFRIAAGRLLLAEAGGLQVDGLRAGVVLATGWEAGAYGGLVPDLYRRVSFADYAAGVLAPGGGAYLDARSGAGWLTLSAGAHFVDGAVRTFAFGSALWRPIGWIDLFAYALVDFTGPEGFVLRNATVRVGVVPDARVRVSVTASHYSALAFREHSIRLLEEDGANNLALYLTARDELRVRASGDLWKLTLYGQARVQRRATTIDPADPYVEAAIGGTLGVVAHDLAGVRLDLSFTRLASYQSRSILVSLAASRELGRYLAFEAAASWLHHRDDLGDVDDGADSAAGGAPLGPAAETFVLLATAIGRLGPNVTLLASYELVHDRTSILVPGEYVDPVGGELLPYPALEPATIHVLFARAQLRW